MAQAELSHWLAVGITDLVDLRAEWTDEDWVLEASPTLKYHHLGVEDRGRPMGGDWFDGGVRIVRDVWERGGTALVHCHLGVNRAPSMAVAVLVALEGWDLVDAVQYVRELRPVAAAVYAEDALGWWLRACTEPRNVARSQRRRLAKWREAHPLDVDLVIASVRDGRRERVDFPPAAGGLNSTMS